MRAATTAQATAHPIVRLAAVAMSKAMTAAAMAPRMTAIASAPTVTRSVRSGAGTGPYDSGVSADDRGWAGFGRTPSLLAPGRTVQRARAATTRCASTGVRRCGSPPASSPRSVLVAFFRNVPDSLTRIGMGVLLAFALDPVVIRIEDRLRCSRVAAVAIVGTSVLALFALIVLIVGPPAVEQAERFGRELPETVEALYDLPLVGGWLDDADAAQEVREWVADLPARVDTRTVTNTAKSLLDGVLAGLVVILVGLAVLVDGERLVRRLRAVIPDTLEPRAVTVGRILYRTVGAYFSGSLLVAVLAATFILVVGLALSVPLAPAAAVWMLLVNLIPQIGGLLGGGFFVLLALSGGVGKGLLCLVLLPGVPAGREPSDPAGHRGRGRRPVGAGHHARRAGRRGGRRRPRSAGGHAPGGGGQGAVPPGALGTGPAVPHQHLALAAGPETLPVGSGSMGIPSELTGPAHDIAKRLVARGETLSVCESSAGGLISAALLSYPGASKFYVGGTVIYTPSGVKAQLGSSPVPAARPGAGRVGALGPLPGRRRA